MRHVLAALALGLLLVGWSPPANAVPDWFKAQVERAGVARDGSVIIQMTDLAAVPAFERRNFISPDIMSKEALAIALSALALNLPVRVRADLDELGAVEIRVIFLLAQ